MLHEFKQGHQPLLIATDVAQRGLDIKDVRCVINFDCPASGEAYVHRIGRSGRFGRKGVAINFLTIEDVPYLKDIEDFYDTTVEEMPLSVGDLI